MTAPVLTGPTTVTGPAVAPHRGDERIVTCVEIAWGYDPTLPYGNQWKDVTPYVRALNTSRGRQAELQRFEAGTLSMKLSNADGRFNPWNTAGAYGSGAVRIGVPIRVRISAEKSDPTGATPAIASFDPTDGGFYHAWYGFVTDIEPDWSDGGRADCWCTIAAAGGFSPLNRADLIASVFTIGGSGAPFAPFELPGAHFGDLVNVQFGHDRFVQVIDQSGVKPLLRGLYLKYDTSPYSNPNGSATAPLGPVIPSGGGHAVTENALSHLQDIAECAFIDLYERPDGLIAWRPYSEVRDQAFDTTTIFGDNAGEIPYQDIGPLYNDENLFNDIDITGFDAVVNSSSDATSMAAYGRRQFSKTIPSYVAAYADAGTPFGFIIALFAGGLSYKNRYKDPVVHIPSVSLSLRALTDAQRMRVLSLPIGYRVQVKRRPPVGDVLTAECFFEGAQLTWEPGMKDVKAVLNLAPSRGAGVIPFP